MRLLTPVAERIGSGQELLEGLKLCRGRGSRIYGRLSESVDIDSKGYYAMTHRTLQDMIATVKSHPAIASAGMLLCHNGFVRATSRSGENVKGLQVTADRKKIEEIREWALSRTGIIAVEIEALEGSFVVGDDLLYVVVAGDIRENVFAAMRATVERLKTEGVSKVEHLTG